MRKVFLLAFFTLGLIACSTESVDQPILSPESTNTLTPLPPTVRPSETSVPPTSTQTLAEPTATASPEAPTETPLPLCVTLIFGGNAQFEILSPSGQRVFVDVYDPEILSEPVAEGDVLLTTHTHWDHWNVDFQTTFPGLQLFVGTGVLEAPGAIIQGIASAHNQGDPFKPEGGTNYLYLIEIGGLRITHFGDIGQTALTKEQLEVLGQVDIAITQLNNPYSEMNAENHKGINLMEQVQPRLIIPTHVNLDTTKLAVAQWPGFYTEAASVQVCESDLGEHPRLLLLGGAATTMIQYLELEKWGNE